MNSTLNVARIYTTEPQLTRALAAEIRHCPKEITAFLEAKLGQQLGTLTLVECEKEARVDVMCKFNLDGKEISVAVEAKVDHFLSQEQLESEASVADFLVALVKDIDDASDFQNYLDATVSWKELLEVIPESRLTVADIENLPAQKVAVERCLRKETQRLSKALGKHWQVYVARGGSAMPGITIESPTTKEGDQIVGQIQVTGRSMPEALKDVQFEFYAGTRVTEDEVSYPDPETNEMPRWVDNALILKASVLDKNPDFYRVKKRKPGTSKRALGKRRKALTEKYLNKYQWLAQGYIDWALGVRVEPRAFDELPSLVDEAATLFGDWYKALEDQ